MSGDFQISTSKSTTAYRGAELREAFLSYFQKQGHEAVKSAPLVPQADPTLLFNNAGMVQFKDVFTGKESRSYTRATSSQKCVRAGGKHNDLENVGRTARHHTFFEMLGNFSFGDYFKEEACRLAWTFLTEELKIPQDRLTVTVFGGDAEDNLPADEEAERIWHEVVGVPKTRIERCGKKDNFWAMGDTGPCGPCTEIHFDRGAVEGAFGGDDPEGDRVLEIWNLVFMQYDRQKDGSLQPLPKPSVDTGMGLERLAMVMNGVASNYDTDLLRPLITLTENASGKTYRSSDDDDDVSMRVIADHARATAFLIADGVLPANDGRGSVLRRIMRRAIRHGHRLGFHELFFHNVCLRVVEMFGEAYAELREARALIEKMVRLEEETFRKTLERGLKLFEDAAAGMQNGDVLDGRTAFRLYETYGFPLDLTEVLATERGLRVDDEGYRAAQTQHAKASEGGGLGLEGIPDAYKNIRQEQGPTRYLENTQEGSAKVIALVLEGNEIDVLNEGGRAQVVLDQTPFYGESGGQVGDTGILRGDGFAAKVVDTSKLAELHIHTVQLESGRLEKGQSVVGVVDNERLERIRRNHSATHLLHLALREVLGDHVVQKGSLVSPERLRFDFSHFEAMNPTQMEEVENRVNRLILDNVGGDVEEMSFDAAREKGAMALFGEKYGEHVRVVAFGPSVELCGGVHVGRTGDIGLFKITSESPLAAGIRRIEAVTGLGALEWVRRQSEILQQTANVLHIPEPEVPGRVEKLKQELRGAEKELEKLKQKAATQKAGEAASDAREINGIKVLTQRLDGMDPKALREYADKLRDKLQSGVVALGVPVGAEKVTLLVALTPDLVGRLHAGKMVGSMAQIVDGRGGGKPDLAQAGGQNPARLDEALRAVEELVASA